MSGTVRGTADRTAVTPVECARSGAEGLWTSSETRQPKRRIRHELSEVIPKVTCKPDLGDEVTSHSALRLWDDNPSLVDFLGFDAVVAPILEAIATPEVDPLALGVHSPWGGGKSTVLNLIEADLKARKRYVVIRTDPWQYDDHDDVRGDLIAEVLDQLGEKFKKDATVTGRVEDLVKRISWSRVGLALGKGALTMQWDTDELLKAFTPRKRSDDNSMAGFKDAFAVLVKGLPEIDRVVVLVDDLDRCLPPAVMATLEAIKLFLAVPKMVFVVAADQDMVREAVAASLGESSRSGAFAVRYLEKIVQLPIALPRLNHADAEAYIGLLLSASEGATPAQVEDLAQHCAGRRRDGKHPLLRAMDGLGWQPSQQTLELAAQLAEGLSADRLANPRQIKRFLNAFGVRSIVANSRSVNIAPSVLMKMLLLEDLHRPSFEALAALDRAGRKDLLEAWEAWGRDEENSTMPDAVHENTKHWAGSSPTLADADIDMYLDLAATLIHVKAGEQTSDAVIRLIGDLLGEADAVREAALLTLVEYEETDQRAAMELMFGQGRRLDDVDVLFGAAVRWAEATNSLVDLVASAADEFSQRLTPGAVVQMGQSPLRPHFMSVLQRVAADDTVDPLAREAARMEVEAAPNGN